MRAIVRWGIRADLFVAERKAYAGEVGEFLGNIYRNGNTENFQKNWLIEFSKSSGVLERTLLNWWHSFCEEHGLEIRPKQALQVDRERFFAWLKDQQAREEAEKQRKQEEADAQIRRDAFADSLEDLAVLTQAYGREAVMAEVIHVYLSQADE